MDFQERFNLLLKGKYGNIHKMFIENKKSGLTYCQLYQYSKKGRVPELENAFKLCKIFDCTLNYLYGFSKKKGHFIYKEEKKDE